MPDDRDLTSRQGERPRDVPDEAETLAALMDGTLRLDDVGDDQLGGVLRVMDSAELVRTIAEAPKLFDAAGGPRPSAPYGFVAPRRASGVRRWAPVPAMAALLIAMGSITFLYLRTRQAAVPPGDGVAAIPPAASSGA